jgi:hypothetical protein
LLVLIIFLLSVVLILSLFILTHVHPLSEYEIERLSEKRRGNKISWYYFFSTKEMGINKDFKKRINPNGAFYSMSERLSDFPSLAAALLKYKKHEWLVIAFEKEKQINMIWVNKGIDRTQVGLFLPLNKIIEIAKQKGDTTVFMFHNHPNTNPNYYSCTKPSERDLESAEAWAKALNANGLNNFEFVCERGRHYLYYRSISESFLPVITFIKEVEHSNGISKWKNLKLHLERIF